MTFTPPDAGQYSLQGMLGSSTLDLPSTLWALDNVLAAPQWQISGTSMVAGQLQGALLHPLTYHPMSLAARAEHAAGS